MEVCYVVLTFGFLPEFLRSPRAAFGGCSPHAPEGAVIRPPPGAFPPGEGFWRCRAGFTIPPQFLYDFFTLLSEKYGIMDTENRKERML